MSHLKDSIYFKIAPYVIAGDTEYPGLKREGKIRISNKCFRFRVSSMDPFLRGDKDGMSCSKTILRFLCYMC